MNYREGQDVKKGDVLAQIDPVTYKALYDQAVAKKAQNEALLENAKRDLQRYEGLAKSDYTSQQQADTQNSTVTQTAALVRQDQANIDNARRQSQLHHRSARRSKAAPASAKWTRAIWSARRTRPASWSSPSSSRFRWCSRCRKPWWARSTTRRRRARCRSRPSVGGKTIGEGKLEVVDNQIDQSTGTVKLKGTFPNEEMQPLAGPVRECASAC